MGVGRALRILGRTFRQLVPSMLAISFMVGLAYVTKYSGMDTVLGLSLTRTGWIYPFFGTLLGWLGVALTGTDAGSNALFGNLQKVTAEQIGISPVLMASANSAGGVMGKMIDAQSIVVASTACRLEGREADVFKAVFWHSLVLASLVGLVVLFYAYVHSLGDPGLNEDALKIADRNSAAPKRSRAHSVMSVAVFTQGSVSSGGSGRRSHAGQPAGFGAAAAGADTRPETRRESQPRGHIPSRSPPSRRARPSRSSTAKTGARTSTRPCWRSTSRSGRS